MSYLSALARHMPRRAWRHLRGHAALHGTGSLALAHAARPLSYRRWLRQAAASLTSPVGTPRELTGWEVPPLPPWTTNEAAASIRSVLAAAAEQAVPLADQICTHGALMRIHSVARRAGLYRDALHLGDVPAHFPYLDRAVVEAALATRPEQRTDPWAPKPLLVQAIGPLAPHGLLTRRDKGHYNAELYEGLAVYCRELAELFDGSALARAGLIADQAIRTALARAASSRTPLAFITETVAAELWLRSIR